MKAREKKKAKNQTSFNELVKAINEEQKLLKNPPHKAIPQPLSKAEEDIKKAKQAKEDAEYERLREAAEAEEYKILMEANPIINMNPFTNPKFLKSVRELNNPQQNINIRKQIAQLMINQKTTDSQMQSQFYSSKIGDLTKQLAALQASQK